MRFKLASEVILPDGQRGWVVAASCDFTPQVVCVKVEDGRIVIVSEDELKLASK
jgi:hypothetical protein